MEQPPDLPFFFFFLLNGLERQTDRLNLLEMYANFSKGVKGEILEDLSSE